MSRRSSLMERALIPVVVWGALIRRHDWKHLGWGWGGGVRVGLCHLNNIELWFRVKHNDVGLLSVFVQSLLMYVSKMCDSLHSPRWWAETATPVWRWWPAGSCWQPVGSVCCSALGPTGSSPAAPLRSLPRCLHTGEDISGNGNTSCLEPATSPMMLHIKPATQTLACTFTFFVKTIKYFSLSTSSALSK